MNPITISALTTHLVSLFEKDDLLRDVWVTGEVSNWKRAGSGHIYFSLKDSGAAINAVMWRNSAQSHNWLPTEGDQVIAHGYVGIYPERGAYQLYANRLRPAGRGELYTRFEELKERLAEEGLFDPERKRTVMPLPSRIGIVTSRDAAALRDILRVLSERWALVDVVLFSTLVQGIDAPEQIVRALDGANLYSRNVETLDTIILARGGGSIEDLWAFNDERVAFAVANSEIPVVAGVGHETDFTIVDFVADVRAPTPSAAAAAVVPDRQDALLALIGSTRVTAQKIRERIGAERRHLDVLSGRLQQLHPRRQLDLRRQSLDDRERRLHQTLNSNLERRVDHAISAQQRLSALSPLSVMRRGFSIVQRRDGSVVTTPVGLARGESLHVRSAGGEYDVTVGQTQIDGQEKLSGLTE